MDDIPKGVPYSREQFQLESLLGSIAVTRELAFADSLQLQQSAVKAGVIQMRAHIFSKQPERIHWTPPARLVRRWGKPRSWWQRLKLRRGFGWLRRFGEVRLEVVVERYQPPTVELTGMLLYPGAATKIHAEMGRPVMHFAMFEQPPRGGSVEVEYAPTNKRPVWLSDRVMAKLEEQTAACGWCEETVIMEGLWLVEHANKHGRRQ
jgi:hypothetical protein